MWHILEHIVLALSLAANAYLLASLAIAYDLPRLMNEPIFRRAEDLKDMENNWAKPDLVQTAMREKFHVHGTTSADAPMPDVPQTSNGRRGLRIRKLLRMLHD